MTNTNTFRVHFHRATLETCNLWDIWSFDQQKDNDKEKYKDNDNDTDKDKDNPRDFRQLKH